MICIGLLFFVFIWAQLIRLVLKVNTVFFNKLKREKGNTIAIEFTSTLMGVVIVLLMVLAPFASKGVERAIIGSTTVIAAVIGIAAKDVIGDMIAGLDSLCFEIPYNYETIIMKQDEKEAAEVKAAKNA